MRLLEIKGEYESLIVYHYYENEETGNMIGLDYCVNYDGLTRYSGYVLSDNKIKRWNYTESKEYYL